MRLIHYDGKVPSIFFPAGRIKNGGTCEFASRKCIMWCPSSGQINDIEKEIYHCFLTFSAREVVDTLHMQLLDMNKLFLQWFAWGDCPAKLTEKITWVIEELAKRKVHQIIFTRNRKLWENLSINAEVVIIYTVETMRNVEKNCRQGIVALPKYKEGKTGIYYGHTKELVRKCKAIHHHTCSGTWTEDANIYKTAPKIYEASCDICCEKKRGCFRLSKP